MENTLPEAGASTRAADVQKKRAQKVHNHKLVYSFWRFLFLLIFLVFSAHIPIAIEAH